MPYLLLTLAALFWGGNYVVGHVLVRNSDPVIMSEMRWALTSILLLMIYHRQVFSNWNKIKKSLPIIIFLSMCGQVLFPVTLYIGLQYTTSLNAAIYMSATPCMVLLINKTIFNDDISRNNYLGVLLSTLGVFYLVLKGDITNINAFKNLNKGDLWAMASAVSWAFYCSFLRKKDKRIPGNAFVTISSLIGVAILTPVTIISLLFKNPVDFSPYLHAGFLTGMAYLVLFPSWLSYVFWNRGIAEVGANRGEIYTHIIPLSGGLFSIIFINTKPEAFHFVSAAFIITGIWLCSKASSTKR